jgi:hypothetical protein
LLADQHSEKALCQMKHAEWMVSQIESLVVTSVLAQGCSSIKKGSVSLNNLPKYITSIQDQHHFQCCALHTFLL